MKRHFILFIILICGFLSLDANADSFNYFNLNTQQSFAAKSVTLPLPMPAPSETPLFDRIAQDFGDYRLRADEAAARVIAGNGLSVVGGLSGVGFTLARNFGSFSMNAYRQLAPDLFDEKRWLVVDELTIIVDAQGLLGELRDDGVIDITESNLAAFAGIAFKRVYRITHFANSYEEGLTKDYDRLVFPFRWFKADMLNRLGAYEYLEKTDSLSVKAGGLVTAPVGYGLAVGAGVLASFEKSAELIIQSLGPDDNAEVGDRVRISYTQEKSEAVEVQARLQADFLGILKLTLLSYDFSYGLKESQTWHLKLTANALMGMEDGGDPLLEEALSRVIKLRTPRIDELQDYIVSSETRKEEIMKSRYAALLIGGKKERRTEHVQTVKDGVVRSFFRHNFLKQRHVQNALSRLVSELFANFLKMPTLVNNSAIESRKVAMEYEALVDLVDDKTELQLDGGKRKLSVALKHEASVTSKSKTLREYFASYLSHYTAADPAVVSLIEGGGLIPPYHFQNSYQISQQGITTLAAKSTSDVHAVIDAICETKPKNKLYRFRSLFNFCKWKLQKDYRNYALEVNHAAISMASYKECSKAKKWYVMPWKKRQYLEICMRKISERSESERLDIVPLWRLRAFLDEFVSQSRDKTDVYELFGLANVHGYGQVSAGQESGLPVRAMFREGLWQGTGIIDAARVENVGRAPAAVSVP